MGCKGADQNSFVIKTNTPFPPPQKKFLIESFSNYDNLKKNRSNVDIFLQSFMIRA